MGYIVASGCSCSWRPRTTPVVTRRRADAFGGGERVAYSVPFFFSLCHFSCPFVRHIDKVYNYWNFFTYLGATSLHLIVATQSCGLDIYRLWA